MKKAVIILALIAIAAGSCTQAAKKNAETSTSVQYGGIYSYGDTSKDSETPNGTVYIYPENDSTALFYVYVCKGAPSYNSGSIDGRITIRNNKAVFQKRLAYEKMDCVLYFEFGENGLTIDEDEEDCGCGFGNAVFIIKKTFQCKSAQIPQYYTNISNEKIYFSEWTERIEQQDKDVVCNEYQEDGGYTSITECTYQGLNLQQVYDIAKGADEHLKQELPAVDIQYTANEVVEVKYQYKSKKHLFIEVLYAGGDTTIEIIENENSTTSKIIYAAD
jgi:hypothetical protein